ncbi:hypothetical protein FHU29_002176 [Hoyosella altamirensis]|uniref:DUF2568 domain-containing protein n=2 Tax=Hoyosella altamirensis TaxID=616997 RepID=A0A839RMV5_9ACTN|nr:hypothetical protein [Hoyosella altamirensis]
MLLTLAVGTVLAVLFVLELIALAAIGVLAWSAGAALSGTAAGIAFGVLAVAAAGAAWFLFAAERPYFDHPPARLVVKVAVFAIAAYSVWSLASPMWAGVFVAALLAVHAIAGLRILPAN